MNTPELSSQNPLHVLVFFSGKATAVRYLRSVDPKYNNSYKVVGAFTNNAHAPGIDFFKKHKNNADNVNRKEKESVLAKESIPCEILDWKTFQSKDPASKREEYFAKLLEVIKRYDFDIIVCSGYHLIIPDFFIEQVFPAKIINTYPAYLPKTGERIFTGIWTRAIQATLDARKQFSCSTAHYISMGCAADTGEVIAYSQDYKLIPGESPKDVQSRLTAIGSDGQALQRALEIIYNERVSKRVSKHWFQKLFEMLSL